MSQKGKLIIAVIACFLPFVAMVGYTWHVDDGLRNEYRRVLFSAMEHKSAGEVRSRLDQIQATADAGISDIEKFIILQRELELLDIYCMEMHSTGIVGAPSASREEDHGALLPTTRSSSWRPR